MSFRLASISYDLEPDSETNIFFSIFDNHDSEINVVSLSHGRKDWRQCHMTARSKLRGQKKEAAFSFCPFEPVESFFKLVARLAF